MSPAHSLGDERSDSGHIVCKSPGYQRPYIQVGQVVQQHLLCWEFTSQGSCSRKSCKSDMSAQYDLALIPFPPAPNQIDWLPGLAVVVSGKGTMVLSLVLKKPN